MERISGHGGAHAVAAARQHGVSVMFTLSGAHVFPLYDAAVKARRRRCASSTSGTSRPRCSRPRRPRKLTRTPGLAVLTAGPGVTNAVSAVTTAWFNGAPLVVLGGRAPDYRWGSGAPAGAGPPAAARPGHQARRDRARHRSIVAPRGRGVPARDRPHRGPVFLDVPMDALFGQAEAPRPADRGRPGGRAGPRRLARIAALLARGAPPGPGAGLRRLDRRRRGRGPAPRRDAAAPGRRQRDGAAACCRAATRCW